MNVANNQPLASVTRQENVFELFEQCATATPEAIAALDEHGATSYRALSKRADSICRFLLAQGLRPEQPVGVLMQRGTELLAALLGIWKAGGAYVPFDNHDPADRVLRLLSLCDCTMVLGDQASLGKLQAGQPRAATTDISISGHFDTGTILDQPAETEPCLSAPGGGQLAYIMFTSGSTGDPKAVEVEHRNVIALLQSAQNLLRFESEDRYLASSTITFDASITELFLPLVTGASLLIRDRSVLLEPQHLADAIREFSVSVVQAAPAVWSVILAEIADFPRLRVAITHGEAVEPELARQLHKYSDAVWNLYGPTETTVWATGHSLSTDLEATLSGNSVPIGEPLEGVKVYVVDDQCRLVEDGVEGELLIGGASVARGYRNSTALTSTSFIDLHGERVYRTGDMVVRDVSGVLHFRGRNDDQMEIRGMRVEPNEVETAILCDPGVAQTVVGWYTTPTGTKAIVAAVVIHAGSSCSTQKLHLDLSIRLPRHMIPAQYLFLSKLPTTLSGKVDRMALQEAAMSPGHNSPANTQAKLHHRPLSRTEQAVAKIWKRVLRVDTIAPDDHFFSIGGDSLSSVQMMLELEELFELQLPVHLAFDAPTLESLSTRIERQQDRADDEMSQGFVFHLAGNGSQTPVFFSSVHLSLARHDLWQVNCPLYAIANWAKGSGFIQAESLEALTTQHLLSVRRIQPKGPYRIAGFSLGGLIALEMAHQLRAVGEKVEMLFLLDPTAPRKIVKPGKDVISTSVKRPDLTIGTRINLRLREIAQGPKQRGWIKWLTLFLPVMLPIRDYRIIDWVHYHLVNQHLRHPTRISGLLFPKDRWKAFVFAAERMVDGYVAKPYEGRSLLVFAHDKGRDEMWRMMLGDGAEIHMLESRHNQLFDDPARTHWMNWLDQAIEPSALNTKPLSTTFQKSD
jgi:enterobactin synthetase component F